MNAPVGFALTNFDKARAAVELCYRVDDVLELKAVAAMVEVYARQACDCHMERQAIDIRLRAERRCGELLKLLQRTAAGAVRNPDGRRGKDPTRHDGGQVPPSEYAQTLERTGISSEQASRYQRLADVPQAEFEASLVGEDLPSSRAIVDRAAAAKDVTEPVKPAYSRRALFLWGRLRDFEEMGVFSSPVEVLLTEMTDEMRFEASRSLTLMRDWMED
jgi:hypothetical protein